METSYPPRRTEVAMVASLGQTPNLVTEALSRLEARHRGSEEDNVADGRHINRVIIEKDGSGGRVNGKDVKVRT